MDLNQLILLAQAPEGADNTSSISDYMMPLAIIMVLFYFMILRPQKNKEQAVRSLVENLKEKDRVVTIGGIHGVVTNVQRDKDEVSIRVDESTGAKIRVGMSAISRVVTDEDKNEKKNEKKKN